MKSMKKSMFVTTILMVVLLIVALSTATFAWYTANTNVGTTVTKVTAATSTSASLVIDNQVAGSNSTNTEVTLTMTNAQAANKPMVYMDGTAVEAGTNTYADFITKFKTFTKDSNGKFASAPSAATPDVISAVSGTGTPNSYIVLTNVGGQALASLKTTVTIEPFYVFTAVASPVVENIGTYYEVDGGSTYGYTLTSDVALDGGKTYYTRANGNDYLRVAVFAATASDGTYYLKGIYGAGTAQRAAAALSSAAIGDTISTTVGSNSLNTDLDSAFKASGSALEIATAVGAGSGIFVKVAVWFEGDSMQNADAGQSAHFSMAFSA